MKLKDKIIHNGGFTAASADVEVVLQRIGGYERFLCNNHGGMNDFKPFLSQKAVHTPAFVAEPVNVED